MSKWLGLALIGLLAMESASADITIPGVSDPNAIGSDGALNWTNSSDFYVDLRQAATGAWNAASPVPGKGVYDPDKWAVVFKYSSVNLSPAAWKNLYFVNHPSGAPVVWLVWGNVTINTYATVVLDGQDHQGSGSFPVPGPGGFRGARGSLGSTPGSGGFGPGGGDLVGSNGIGAASSATTGWCLGVPAAPTYGNLFVLPLIGGSGGAAWGTNGNGGGAGGGAILIVATGTITVNGKIFARGLGCSCWTVPGGSGGSIRLIANTVYSPQGGQLRATGGSLCCDFGGDGRIFVQANQITMTDEGQPAAKKTDFLDSPYLIWPDSVDPNFPGTQAPPKIWPVKFVVDGMDVPIPTDPRASLDFPLADTSFDTQNPVTLQIAAANVPLDWTVVVRVVAKSGNSFSVTANPLQQTPEGASTTAQLTLPRGFGAIQVRAYKPASALSSHEPGAEQQSESSATAQ